MRRSFQVIATTLSKTAKHASVFVLGIVMARTLPVDTYGTFLQVQLVVDTLLYAAIFGIPHSVYFFLPRVRFKRRFMVSTMNLMLGLAIFVSIGTFYSTSWISARLNNPELASFAIIIAALLFLQIPIKIFEPAMISLKKVRLFVAVNATFNVSFLFVVLAPLLTGASLLELFYVIVGFHVAQFVAIATALFFSIRGIIDDENGEDFNLRGQLGFSLPIGISGVIGEIARQVDKIIVSTLFGPAQYAIYTRGALQIPLLNVVSNSLHNILMPDFVEAVRNDDTPALLSIWHSAMRLMAMFVYPTFVFFVATADIFIPTLYSDKYAEASIIFQIYMFTLLTRITSADSIIRALGKTGVLAKMSIFSIFMNVTLTYYMISQLGVIGAPLATVLTTFVVFGVYLRVVGRKLHLGIAQLVPWSSLFQFLVMSLLAILCATLIRFLGLPRLILLMCMALTFALLYFVQLRRSSVLSDSERDALRSILPRRLRWAI